MAERYSRILDSARYYAQLTNYLDYIQNMDRHNVNVGEGDPRPPSATLFIEPFNYDLTAGQVHRTSGAEPTFANYGTRGGISGRVTDVAPTGDGLIVKLANFKPARVIITTGRSSNGVVKTSRVTKAKYLSYGGTSTSLPFGKLDATDIYSTAVDEIRAGIEPGLGANDTIAFQQEKLT